jgi:hypothetical protein
MGTEPAIVDVVIGDEGEVGLEEIGDDAVVADCVA